MTLSVASDGLVVRFDAEFIGCSPFCQSSDAECKLCESSSAMVSAGQVMWLVHEGLACQSLSVRSVLLPMRQKHGTAPAACDRGASSCASELGCYS